MQIAVKASFKNGRIFPLGQMDFGSRHETLFSECWGFFLGETYSSLACSCTAHQIYRWSLNHAGLIKIAMLR